MRIFGIRRIFLYSTTVACLLLLIFYLNVPLNGKPTRFLGSTGRISKPDEYPGQYVKREHPTPSNYSYCNFNYGFPFELTHEDVDIGLGPEQGKKSLYRILYNVVEAKMDGVVPSVTYATHLSADFVNYLPELVRYWDGLISVAAYVPDTDAVLVLEQIQKYCYCLPGMSRVSVHLVFDKKLPPSRKDIYFPKPSDCNVVDSSKIQTYRDIDERISYPVNVCRNAARIASLTENVLVSDIQLMPSKDLAKNFHDMMEVYSYTECPKKVFVVPVFEVQQSEQIPRSKSELVELIREAKAVYFHKMVCSHCQKFPGIEAWMNTDPGDAIKPLLTARREVPYNRWEPIYIGTKDEPFYNEKLSWEGLQDKMLQVLEMCLIGYKFVILDGAFLVHWPGIKTTKNLDDESWRKVFIKQNTLEYQRIIRSFTAKYKLNQQCRIK